MLVGRADNGFIFDGPECRIALPSIQGLAVKQQNEPLLLLCRCQLIDPLGHGQNGRQPRPKNGKLGSQDFITSSHVISRFWSMAMRPMMAVRVLSAVRTQVISGVPF
jgi:hypothetical protein